MIKMLSSASSVSSQNKVNLSELEEFKAVGKIVHNDLLQEDDNALSEAVHWCSKVFEYNLKDGKKNRGTYVLRAYKTLSPSITSEGLLSASILGWCVELLQAVLVIFDDIMDESVTRRGQLCWYKNPEVGLSAINDGLLLLTVIYKILRKHFEHCDFYLNIVHEFLQATEKTAYGQCLDMLSNPPHCRPKYEYYTSEKYGAIVKYKASYYTYCLPVHLAMHLVGNKKTEDFDLTRKLCLKLGHLFQSEDDFLDLYCDSKITGKEGTDIVQGKCTWFAVTFLEHADERLKNEWIENYGMNNEESVSKILQLYKKLDMFDKFKKFEQDLYAEINLLISSELTDNTMQELFYYLLNKTFKREK